MLAAVDATPPKPRMPATTATTRNTSAQYSIDFSVGVRPETRFQTGHLHQQRRMLLGSRILGCSEADAEPNPEIIDALVFAGEAGIRSVVEHHRYLVDRIDAVAELESLAEQHVGAEALAVRSTGPELAIIEARPEEDAEGEAVIRQQDVADQLPCPGRAEIILIGVFAGIELGAERAARLQRPSDVGGEAGDPGIADRRREDHLGIDVDPVLLATGETHIVRQAAELQLAVGQVLGISARRHQESYRADAAQGRSARCPPTRRPRLRSFLRDHSSIPRLNFDAN